MPTEPFGDGLPTNLINKLLVGRDETVYAATTLGVALSRDKGRTWKYWRGRDYAAKVKGLYRGAPGDWWETPAARLAKDYVTCLAEDALGRIWIGYRQQGYELLAEERAGDKVGLSSSEITAERVDADSFVTALLPIHCQGRAATKPSTTTTAKLTR